LQTEKEKELADWNEKASAYDLHAGKITRQAIEPLLDVIDVSPGMQVLDIATGPGYLAGAAHMRGAIATGIDNAGSMIAQAKQNYPDALFYEGDAESMIFPDKFFDVAICSFGLFYLPEPEKSVSSTHRVLVSGGKYAFTTWAISSNNSLISLIINAIAAHGSNDLTPSEKSPFLRFSEPDECHNILKSNNFTDIEVSELPLFWKPDHPDEVLDMIYKSSVKTDRLLASQNHAAREKIHQHLAQAVSEIIDSGDELSCPVLIATAVRAD
jgi:ubiquinone/menaquinone biosynthesis C-methylase UbiE